MQPGRNAHEGGSLGMGQRAWGDTDLSAQRTDLQMTPLFVQLHRLSVGLVLMSD